MIHLLSPGHPLPEISLSGLAPPEIITFGSPSFTAFTVFRRKVSDEFWLKRHIRISPICPE